MAFLAEKGLSGEVMARACPHAHARPRTHARAGTRRRERERGAAESVTRVRTASSSTVG
jgi:hypothetical protein